MKPFATIPVRGDDPIELYRHREFRRGIEIDWWRHVMPESVAIKVARAILTKLRPSDLVEADK